MTTKVIFRQWPNGDVIALFPEVPATRDGYTCQSYEHVGQHGSANLAAVIKATKPAVDYADIAAELVRIGYVTKVVRRANRAQHAKRLTELTK